MGSTTIAKELSRRKVPGSIRPFILDRVKGIIDASHDQLFRDEFGNTSTPWITSRYQALAEYESFIYNKVEHATESIAVLVYSESKELELIDYPRASEGSNTESSERLAESIAIKNAENKKREKEIILHLASLKSELEKIDEALHHHIQRAKCRNKRHIYAYWSGFMRAFNKNGNEDIKLSPNDNMTEISSKPVYEECYKRLIKQIDGVIEGRNSNETTR